MSSSMVVHDKRLAGTPPSIAPNIFEVHKTFPLRDALGWISTYARSNSRLDNLYVMCHGYEQGIEDPSARVSTYAEGYGLQFCKEDLTFRTVGLTSVLKDLVAVITLYACGPANTRKGYQNTWGDGVRFCKELACFTNADVIASSQTQYYTTTSAQKIIDFGSWEGKVYRFTPKGDQLSIQ